MKRTVRVYIASPYQSGNKEVNVKLQISAAYHLLKLGFNPYMPLYNHYVQVQYPELNECIPWVERDKGWLDVCDILVRLHPIDANGVEIPSTGADEEEKYARHLSIPVIHCKDLEELVNKFKTFETTV